MPFINNKTIKKINIYTTNMLILLYTIYINIFIFPMKYYKNIFETVKLIHENT